jgi:hypothetical protein
MSAYCIRLRGQVEVSELNPRSPQVMTLVNLSPTYTLLTISTDQSGMIGLLRHLHSLGVEILSVERKEA